MRSVFVVLFSLIVMLTSAQAQDWSAVEKALGRPGSEAAGIYKVSFPRTDLHVKIGNTKLEPGAALGTWMAFRRVADGTVVADGDLVVTAAELGPVTSALVEGGLEVSAIHNHVAGEQPAVYYVHFFFHGDLERALAGLRKALDATATPTGAPPPEKMVAMPYDAGVIEKTLALKGSQKGTVLAFSIPRKHAVRMHGQELPPAMGMAAAINFQPSPKGVAATGDFVLREEEVPRVVKHLRQHGVLLTALHNHLLDDEPRMAFLHFWIEGEAEGVARKLKGALELLE